MRSTTHADYLRVGEIVAATLGRTSAVAALTTSDFARLRATLAAVDGPTTLALDIGRVDDALFVDDPDRGISWLGNPADLYGWLSARLGNVVWRRGLGCVTKEEVFAEVRRTAKAYRAIETLASRAAG